MDLSIRLLVQDPEASTTSFGKVRVRYICEWNQNCELSNTFGEGDLAWTESADAEETEPVDGEGNGTTPTDSMERREKKFIASADYTSSIGCDFSDQSTLQTFNDSPGVYAIYFKEEQRDLPLPEDAAEGTEPEKELHLVPIGFTYLDCSVLLVSGDKPIKTSVYINDFIIAEMEIKTSGALLDESETLKLEPLLVDMQHVINYPVNKSGPLTDTEKYMYTYSRFDMGNGKSRMLYVRPQASAPSGNQEQPQGDSKIGFENRLCMFPGLEDLTLFRAMLQTHSFTIEVHRENIFTRIFHTDVQESFHKMIAEKEVPGEGEEEGQTVIEKLDLIVELSNEVHKGDEYLLDIVKKGITLSSQVNPHGAARFRLEGMLDTSADLLKEFAMRMDTPSGEHDVTLKEEISSSVRLERPTKPNKWKSPSDISLKDALMRERPNVYNMTKKEFIKPHHLLFDDFDTLLMLNVELHRYMNHTKKVVVPDPDRVIDSDVEDSDEEGVEEKKTDDMIENESGELGFTKEVLVMPQEQIQRQISELSLFTRAVLVFAYKDDVFLSNLNRAILDVNMKALPNIQGSIRSYTFTDEELVAANDGSLDVITGFTIIDNDYRVVVIEGRAGEGHAMEKAMSYMPRLRPNDKSLSILANPQVRFQKRLYASFGPDLKRIRVRDTLFKLARKPELYNRKLVSKTCFDAIDNVMSLRWSPDLLKTKEMEVYPSAQSLNTVELLYGEAVSRVDLDGNGNDGSNSIRSKNSKSSKSKSSQQSGAKSPSSKTSGTQDMTRTSLHDDAPGSPSSDLDMGSTEFKDKSSDCRNYLYEEYLLARANGERNKDFLAEQREYTVKAEESKQRRIAERNRISEEVLEKVLGDRQAKIHIYATQSENFKRKAYAEVRSRLATLGDATYTFSKEYVSQTIPVVDPASIKDERTIDRSKWKTQKGFKYPKPKTLKDLITHPKRPSEFVIEGLKEPWTGDLPLRMLQSTTKDPAEEIKHMRLEKGYTTRIKGGQDFGALKSCSYDREFQLKLVGDRTKLPRGKLTQGGRGDKNKDAFKSVHLVSEEMTKKIEEAQLKDIQDWKDKVVVDSTSSLLQMGGFKQKDKCYQFERAKDILRDEPARPDLKHLRNRKSSTGRDFSFAPPPLSIFKEEGYVENQAMNMMSRSTDQTKFITTKDTGEPQDFVRFIDLYSSAPKSVKLIHNRKAPPLKESEKVGVKWGNPV
jgi:hypothetical protein